MQLLLFPELRKRCKAVSSHLCALRVQERALNWLGDKPVE